MGFRLAKGYFRQPEYVQSKSLPLLFAKLLQAMLIRQTSPSHAYEKGKFMRIFGWSIFFIAFIGFSIMGGGSWYLFNRLPPLTMLKDVHLQVPLRVCTRDERLIGEFGEKRRIPLGIEEIPDAVIKAVLAAEDKDFFQHPGIDWKGLMRAVVHLVRTGRKGPGGSTITMQVARNFFLGREKTYLRKANELLLALKIEQEFTKEEILTLYLNKIFFGQRAYGVGAAAQVYYGVTLDELTLPQMAMIAGLPKAPSRYNPIADPTQAKVRRNYVLTRMHELDYITDEQYTNASNAPITASLHKKDMDVEAPYVAEMARAWMENVLGQEAYTGGYHVYTTIDSQYQKYTNEALRKSLLVYDRRHGYRGPERRLSKTERRKSPDKALTIPDRIVPVGGLIPAVVKKVRKKSVHVVSRETGEIKLPWKALSWAQSYIDRDNQGPKPKTATEILSPGDVIRLEKTESGWRLAQVPEVQGALVSITPSDGAILALAGGFSFYHSKFNRATQARRQPGSSFKPFIYATALDAGLTSATMINDAPIVHSSQDLEEDWRPENYSGKFYGPTRLREALVHSRNLVSIRLLRRLFRKVGINRILDDLTRFGFDRANMPSDLSLALGSGTASPLDLATAYSIFANGGYRVESYFVERVLDADGQVIMEADPLRVCQECDVPLLSEDNPTEDQAQAMIGARPLAEDELPQGQELDTGTTPSMTPRIAPRVLNEQNTWLINSMLRDVIRRGTGSKARELGRRDLAGKTGTTNDQKDAWFCGFTAQLVTTAWVGFDLSHPLGRYETGSRVALPMWMEFMDKALKGLPQVRLEQPNGLVTVRIDPKTGLQTSAKTPNAIFETFREEHVPKSDGNSGETPARHAEWVTEQLF